MIRKKLRLLVLIFISVLALACGDDEEPTGPGGTVDSGQADAIADTSAVDTSSADTGTQTGDVTGDTAVADSSDAQQADIGGEDAGVDDLADVLGEDASGDAADLADIDERPEALSFEVGPPLRDPPADPLADSDLVSCALYQDEVCGDGNVLSRCAVYDLDSEAFVDFSEVDPLFRRVLMYERWYDLYQSPNGTTSERLFNQSVAPGTAEAVWGDLDHFGLFDGHGDGAIWTGAALNAHLLRFTETGTEADYQRMEDKVGTLVHHFDVTGIEGYLARTHYLRIPGGDTSLSDDFIIVSRDDQDWRHYDIEDVETFDWLPDAYVDGFDVGDQHYEGTPRWNGNPSIDQYTGPMVTFPAAFSMLRDTGLRDRMVRHLQCYLNRLVRIEIHNLEENQEAMELVEQFLAGGTLNITEDDFDFREELDVIVGYVNMQPNSVNYFHDDPDDDTFDASCPDGPSLTADDAWIIDATSRTFIADVTNLIKYLRSDTYQEANSIDHFYIPSIRGADAMHLMHLATMVYYMTGDERYADFLTEELMRNMYAPQVATTMGALVPPAWCRSYYGNHISFSPLWAFINLLEDSELRTHLQQIMVDEVWEEEMYNLGNAKLDLMLAGVVPDSMIAELDAIRDEGVQIIEEFGGFQGDADACESDVDCPYRDDPRRTYSIDYATNLARLPEGSPITGVCPTEDQRALCEDGFVVFGAPIPGNPISYVCDAENLNEGQCLLETGLCADKYAGVEVADGEFELTWLPVNQRSWRDFQWQANPHRMFRAYGTEGGKQSPGLDLIESFWLARYYDFIDNGDGQVLVWEAIGGCE